MENIQIAEAWIVQFGKQKGTFATYRAGNLDESFQIFQHMLELHKVFVENKEDLLVPVD
jgi:hypothetical protein